MIIPNIWEHQNMFQSPPTRYSNVINHPPVITIDSWYVHHSQSWVVYCYTHIIRSYNLIIIRSYIPYYHIFHTIIYFISYIPELPSSHPSVVTKLPIPILGRRGAIEMARPMRSARPQRPRRSGVVP